MKVVVFTCSTGGGHNACANYIREEFISRGIECDVKDYMEIIGPHASHIAEKMYLDSTKGNGKVFGSVYKLGEMYSKTRIPSPVYGLNKLLKYKLYRYLLDHHYDLSIGTQLFACMGLTAVKQEFPISFINVATDYECIPFWEETNPDYFVIPSPFLKERFIKKGFPEDVLLPFGIPISSRFLDCKASDEIPNDKDVILITSGSMGFGQLKDVVLTMLKEIPDTYLVVVCGNNKTVYEELSQIDNPLLIVKGFVHNMNEIMKASTLVITKPGGVTTTEVVELRKPLILMMPIPGVEDYNARFFEEHHMSLNAKTISDLIDKTKLLLLDKKLQKDLVKNQKECISSYSAKALVDFVLEHMK